MACYIPAAHRCTRGSQEHYEELRPEDTFIPAHTDILLLIQPPELPNASDGLTSNPTTLVGIRGIYAICDALSRGLMK